MSALVEKLNLTIDRYWPARGLRLIGSNPGFRSPMYPYEALRGPTYREYSHVNHTWDPPPRLLLLGGRRWQRDKLHRLIWNLLGLHLLRLTGRLKGQEACQDRGSVSDAHRRASICCRGRAVAVSY